ncbi:MAG: right-handed parallel beta-helix repeat-containing protein [Clostridia bacterium]|nr:right-handed parallel beta-helix repeat-containing protein [Clostridia bacterium]
MKNKLFTLTRIVLLLFSLLLVSVFLLSCGEEMPEITKIGEKCITVSYDQKEVRVNYLRDPAPINEKGKEKFFNVLDFGAAGDGVTDDTEACRRALAVVDNGGTVYFPGGTYLITDQLCIPGDNITLRGDGNTTKIVYTRVQDDSPLEDQSLIGFKPGIRNITVKDLHMEYHGEFFGGYEQSYLGKINCIYFLEAHRVLVENVEINGFNSSGVHAAGKNSAYATDVTVRDCYLHHNRVAGVKYGYVDGIIIENNVMEYHGSDDDGGTGYGCAGLKAAYPYNARVINNEANYNYRKGIDVHAGENIVIEGNTCRGNKLYGIYVEGPRTNHITIKNNVICDMVLETAYADMIYGITIGTDNDGYADRYYDYQIIGNIVENFSLSNGRAFAIGCYPSFENGKITIKDNILNCGTVYNLIDLGKDFSGQNVSFIIDGNQMYAEEVVYPNSAVKVEYYNSLVFTNNMIEINSQDMRTVNLINKNDDSVTVVTGNTVISKSKQSPINISATRPPKCVIRENNIIIVKESEGEQ